MLLRLASCDESPYRLRTPRKLGKLHGHGEPGVGDGRGSPDGAGGSSSLHAARGARSKVGRTEQTNVKFHRLIESLVKTSNRAFFAQYALNFSVFLSYDVTEIRVDFVGDENHYSVNSTLYELSTVSVKLYVPLCAPTHERPVYA
jgi:hypothetical protein